MENEDIFMQINNLSLSDELAEAKEDSTSKEENDAIITNLGTYMQTFFKSLYRKSIIMIRSTIKSMFKLGAPPGGQQLP